LCGLRVGEVPEVWKDCGEAREKVVHFLGKPSRLGERFKLTMVYLSVAGVARGLETW